MSSLLLLLLYAPTPPALYVYIYTRTTAVSTYAHQLYEQVHVHRVSSRRAACNVQHQLLLLLRFVRACGVIVPTVRACMCACVCVRKNNVYVQKCQAHALYVCMLRYYLVGIYLYFVSLWYPNGSNDTRLRVLRKFYTADVLSQFFCKKNKKNEIRQL